MKGWALTVASSVRLQAFVLGTAYVLVLLATAKDLGYARDEGFYFQAAESYSHWFALLLDDPGAAIQRQAVERYWSLNHEHPALIKSLFALSYELFYNRMQLFERPGTSYRFVGMLFGGLALGMVYLWAAKITGRGAALVAALLFAGLPRLFFHAHLACFDVPVLGMWLLVTYAYWLALKSKGWGGAVVVALLYGLMLNTKHNAWIVPPLLTAHWIVTVMVHRTWRRDATWWCPPRPLLALMVLGPMLLFASWPWLWFDTSARLSEWAEFHLRHVYYNMEFLGQTYWRPPMPRLYAPLMTLATVPLVTLVASAIGLWRVSVVALAYLTAAGASVSEEQRFDAMLLWVVCMVGSYAPWLSTDTPIFGGTKHWITAYPYVCLLAALGFDFVRRQLTTVVGESRSKRSAVALTLGLAIVAGPLTITAHAHPFQLSDYTPIVGGAPGGATLGLNRTFWGYTTSAIAPSLNREAKRGARVYVHDTAMQSFLMMQRDGALRADLRPTLAISEADFAIYHHEPHMGRVEYQIWVDFGTTTPDALGTHDGVPVVWLYRRPP